MYNPFFSSMIVGDRVQARDRAAHGTPCLGGRDGLAEAQSMIIEKVQAAGEAMTTLMLGGSPETVIARYREHVAFTSSGCPRIARGLTRASHRFRRI